MPNGIKGFQKGRKKTGGRIKGKPSVKSEEIRALWASFLENKMRQINTIFDNLEDNDKARFLVNASRLVLPSKIDVDADIEEKKTTFEDDLMELSKAIENNSK